MKQSRVRVQAYAKINLTLDVLEKRRDGYHNIRSIMQSISLYDRLCLTRTEKGISIECNHPEVPCSSANLACRAAQELQKAAQIKYGVHIDLHKNIPVAAGLGGGSADAAAVLLGLNRLWNIGFDMGELCEIGKRIGADVPFCLTGGTALAEGIGEILTPLNPINRMWLVLFNPFFGVSTGEIYSLHDKMETRHRPSTDAFLAGMREGDFRAMAAAMGNSLQETTAVLYPEVADMISRLQAKGVPKVLMCGSGPTVCAVVENRGRAERLKKECSDFNGEIYVVHTVPRAQVFLKRQIRGEKVGRKKAYTNNTGKLQTFAGNSV